MSLDQTLAFAILGGMLVLFVWERFRYDVVAVLALVTAVICGVVPPEEALSGFSDQIVVIVGSALVLSAAVARSGVVETLVRPLVPFMTSSNVQVAVLVSAVAILSAFIKNIGALAIFLPVALQICKRNGTPPSRVLMPMAFASLIGGLTTLIGTSPNVIVSRMRAEIVGEPFEMFDFTPVGVGICLIGIAFLTFGWRLLPKERRSPRPPEELFKVEDYTTEVRVPRTSPMVGKTIADIESLSEGDVRVTTLIRQRHVRHSPAGRWPIAAEDSLVLEGDPQALKTILDKAKVELAGTKEGPVANIDPEDIGVVEAVVTEGSPLIGASPQQIRLRERFAVHLLAVSRSGTRIARQLRQIHFRAGDVIVLQGPKENLPDILATLGCLPLAERKLQLGRPRKALMPILILAGAIVVVTLELLPVAVGFFAAAIAVLLTKSLTVREAYDSLEGSILVLLGALIPVSEAVRATGGTDLIAQWLSVFAVSLPPALAVGLMLVAAMAVTPFLNNAATVLVMAPIAASLAGQLGLSVDAFLMAVAIGAACDFLTPIGHQCNTLVMGPGGYRFGDYWRLGLPLSTIVVVLGTALIVVFWPLQSG